MPDTCNDCNLPMRREATSCPHCGRPSRFPNVNYIDQKEQDALKERYKDYLVKCPAENRTVLTEYGKEVERSKCVIARNLAETERLSASDTTVYETFYGRLKSGRQKYQHQGFDKLRSITDNLFFGETIKDNIRFGSLTLDDCGIDYYGECFWILKTDLISHRATLMEENSVFFAKKHNLGVGSDGEIPEGYRALWKDRGILAVSKLDGDPKTLDKLSSAQCLQRGGSMQGGEDDVFIEVHIWGEITVRSLEKVTVKAEPSQTRSTKTKLKIVKERLELYNVRHNI